MLALMFAPRCAWGIKSGCSWANIYFYFAVIAEYRVFQSINWQWVAKGLPIAAHNPALLMMFRGLRYLACIHIGLAVSLLRGGAMAQTGI